MTSILVASAGAMEGRDKPDVTSPTLEDLSDSSTSSWQIFRYAWEEGRILHPLTVAFGDFDLPLLVQSLLVESTEPTGLSAGGISRGR